MTAHQPLLTFPSPKKNFTPLRVYLDPAAPHMTVMKAVTLEPHESVIFISRRHSSVRFGGDTNNSVACLSGTVISPEVQKFERSHFMTLRVKLRRPIFIHHGPESHLVERVPEISIYFDGMAAAFWTVRRS